MDGLTFGTGKKRKDIDDSDEVLLTPKKARIRYALSQGSGGTWLKYRLKTCNAEYSSNSPLHTCNLDSKSRK
jgi:hypothetical protein